MTQELLDLFDAPVDDSPVRVLISGSRNWVDEGKIRDALLPLYREHGSNVILVHGAADGADTIAARIAEEEFGWWAEPHPAKWVRYGNGAGPIRNREMVKAGADHMFAFLMPNSVGTNDCIDAAVKAGMMVKVIWDAPEDRARRGV